MAVKEDHRSPAEIERDIERTRERISATASALQDDLRPENLLALAADRLKSENVKTFYRNLGCSIRDNPLPLALTGVGITWLMLADSGNGHSSTRTASQRLAHSRDRVRERAGEVGERARDLGHRAAETARGARRSAGDAWDRMLDRQPLLLGVFGVAIGAALASWLPPTETEDELIGETSDRMKRRAMERGRSEAERVRRSAEQGSERYGAPETSQAAQTGYQGSQTGRPPGP